MENEQEEDGAAISYQDNDTPIDPIFLCINELLRLYFDENKNEALIGEKTILLLLHTKYNVLTPIDLSKVVEEYQKSGWIVDRMETDNGVFVWYFQVREWNE